MKKLDLTGLIFGKLTALCIHPYNENYWVCICNCNKFKSVKHKYLLNADIKSCGCLALESSNLNLKKINNLKYSNEFATARVIWQKYYKEINFKDFYNLSQLNCFYCNICKSNNYKLRNYTFNYNGLDRLDSLKTHILDNVIICCKICNRSKRERSFNDFIQYIYNLYYYKQNRLLIEDYKSLYIKVSNINIKHATNAYKHGSYNDSDITLNQFIKLSQLNCYYCNSKPSNNYRSKGFIYNGLDRINNNLKHIFNNVITCCKYCNFAKSNLSLQEFDNWIDKIYNNLKLKKLI